MTDAVVGRLRAQREVLYDGLPKLQLAAASVDSAETPIALAALDEAAAFVRGTFAPYSRAEEYTLFIAVDGVLGAVGSCAPLTAQHRSIAAMGDDLERVIAAARTDGDVAAYGRYLLPLLHGLYALMRAHLESEDDAFLELLDTHLSESQVGMIVDNIERIAAGGQA